MQRISKHLTYANVAATVAVVFALTGGAYAASGGVSGGNTGGAAGVAGHYTASVAKSKKKTSSKGVAGPRGPKGETGPAGAPGAKGETGPAGTNGTNGTGSPGPEGKTGSNGQSVTSATFAGEKTVGGVTCKGGGAEFSSASGASAVCNGEKGERGLKGLPGEPWSPNSELPEKATETGSWSIGPLPEGISGLLPVSVASFTVHLKEPLPKEDVHLINSEGEEVFAGTAKPQTVCTGSVEDPTAPPGNLCVYDAAGDISSAKEVGLFRPETGKGFGAGVSGAMLVLEEESGGRTEGRGTWAVTGAEG